MDSRHEFSRRTFLAAAAAATCTLPAAAQTERTTPMPSKPPNVLFILVDQMQAAMLGCMGNPLVRTPHLDALAARGVLFTNAVANCPVCTPSRAMLMTGKYPLSNRTLVNDLPMPTNQAFFAAAFRDAGYKTGHIGKWHLDGIPREKFTPPGPRRAGFDTFWATYNCHHDYFHPKYYLDTDELITPEGYEPTVQTDLALEFMTKYKENPFFLMISFGPPHAPYQLVPDAFRAMYDPDTMTYRANCEHVNAREYCDYYAQVAAIDVEVGRLLDGLDTQGLADNTLVVFTADHGDMMYSHGRTKKQQPWEESVHIPLIMNRCGLPPDKWGQPPLSGKIAVSVPIYPIRSDILIGMADMAPTVLALAGITPPAEMEGWDLSGAILGHGREHDSLPIFDYIPVDQAQSWGGHEWRGVRTKTHTYARFQDKGWVLYDNAADPYQQNNLIDNPEYKDLQAQLEAELQTWLDRMGDRFLTAEEQLKALGQWEQFQERNDSFPWSRKRAEAQAKPTG